MLNNRWRRAMNLIQAEPADTLLEKEAKAATMGWIYLSSSKRNRFKPLTGGRVVAPPYLKHMIADIATVNIMRVIADNGPTPKTNSSDLPIYVTGEINDVKLTGDIHG